MVERIAVIGNSGGGKLTLARKLAAVRGLPYAEIDKLLWRPGWALASPEEYETDHARLIAAVRRLIEDEAQAGKPVRRIGSVAELDEFFESI